MEKATNPLCSSRADWVDNQHLSPTAQPPPWSRTMAGNGPEPSGTYRSPCLSNPPPGTYGTSYVTVPPPGTPAIPGGCLFAQFGSRFSPLPAPCWAPAGPASEAIPTASRAAATSILERRANVRIPPDRELRQRRIANLSRNAPDGGSTVSRIFGVWPPRTESPTHLAGT